MTDSNTDHGSVPPVERVRQEVDRWLEAVRNTGERAMETLGLTGANRPVTPAVDIVELPDEILIQIDLPGIAAEAVDLSLVGNMLTLVATRVRQEFPDAVRAPLRERFVGRYQRSIPLPAPVNDDAIRAETRDGLLTITLKKSTPTQGRSIPVMTGTAAVSSAQG